jgi:hypothetical protein
MSETGIRRLPVGGPAGLPSCCGPGLAPSSSVQVSGQVRQRRTSTAPDQDGARREPGKYVRDSAAPPVPDHSSRPLRNRLMRDRRCLSASRRSTEPRVGLVGRRGGRGGAVASVSSAVSLAAAASRLRSCDLYSLAVTVITPRDNRPDSAASARSRSTGGSAAVPAISKESSAWLSVVLTDWPPGPDDRENRQESSSGGIMMPRTVTSIVTASHYSRPDAEPVQSGTQSGRGA